LIHKYDFANKPVQLLAHGVKRWWHTRTFAKLPANPDGMVHLNHMEENQRDVGPKLIVLFPTLWTQVAPQLGILVGLPIHLANGNSVSL
jgi:hypothetical protein